jgi:RNA polymerase sigma factor (TIGR02999 family)
VQVNQVDTLNELLDRARAGDRLAYDQAFASIYAELQSVARRTRRQLGGATLNTTGLVHECYLRLQKNQSQALSASHFLGMAAQAMRHMLIEMARARLTEKRGGAIEKITIDEIEVEETRDAEELLTIDNLLRQLEREQPQQAAIVACRFFGGLSDEETAAALSLSPRTVQREWARARDWLAAQGRS